MDSNDWIQTVKARGLGWAFSVLLDALEPLGPLGAQILWIAQPVSGLFGASHAFGELADALEQPGGIDGLRRRLNDD
jgi:hypothetical protein